MFVEDESNRFFGSMFHTVGADTVNEWPPVVFKIELDKLQSRERRSCLLNVGSHRRSNQPNLKSKNEEKFKTTARLTQRDVFKTIFRLARPAFFRFSLLGEMLSTFNTTNQATFQDPKHMPGYAGYCPQAKFWHYGDTFGNTTAKCFQERRTAKLNSSVTKQPGTSSDGRIEFPTVYSNTPDLVLSARARTRERWRNAKKYSLFNEHERGREVKEFDQLAQSHRDHYMDRSGTVQREEHFVISRKEGPKSTDDSFFYNGVKLSCPSSGELMQAINRKYTAHLGLPLKVSPTSMCTWRDRALRDVYFEKR